MRITVVILLVLVTYCSGRNMMTSGGGGGTDCDHNAIVNGCSVLIGDTEFPYFNKEIFTPDCNKHDICYNCGSVKGVSRVSCDRKFRNNLFDRCDDDDSIDNKVWCHMVMFDYWTMVRLLEEDHYLDTSPSWCSESWVNECMN